MLRTSCAIRSCITSAGSRLPLRLRANSPFLPRHNGLRLQQFSVISRLAQEPVAVANGDTGTASASRTVGPKKASRTKEHGEPRARAARGGRTLTGRTRAVNTGLKRNTDRKPYSAATNAPHGPKTVPETAKEVTSSQPDAAPRTLRPPTTIPSTRKYMNPAIRDRKKAKRHERREQERKDVADGKIPDPKLAKLARRAEKKVDNKNKPAWLVQKEALKRKYGDEGWNPRRKLSPDVIEGIRALNENDPETFTTPVLAKEFAASPEAIRRILKSKFRPTGEQLEDRRRRWEKRGMQVWQRWAEEQGIKPPKKWRMLGVGKSTVQGEPPVWKKWQSELGRPASSGEGAAGEKK